MPTIALFAARLSARCLGFIVRHTGPEGRGYLRQAGVDVDAFKRRG